MNNLFVKDHNRLQVLTFFFLGTLLAFSASASEGGLSDYLLGSGDQLSIHVFEEEDLSLELRLSDAGTIAYPFLGEIKAKNLRVGELSELIRAELADGYLVNPIVSVTVLEYRQFYINGQVEKPGGYPYLPGLTVQKAAALAGGFTERASKEKMFVIRDEGELEEPIRSKLTSPVQPGDVVIIEESFF